MDRLHTVVLAALAGLALAACERSDGRKPPPATGERVNAVVAEKRPEQSAAEFCDVQQPADTAPALSLPPLTAGQDPPATGSWRWINVWATWCKPCVEEMPLLTRWQSALAGEGLRFDLVFLSVDESDDLVSAFRDKYPATPPSLRLERPDVLPPWLAELGIGEGAPIPIHLFVDPANRVRCVRAGSVKEQDLPAIRSVLGS
jgi:thiol-disulfide isomerase/thioredoxin